MSLRDEIMKIIDRFETTMSEDAADLELLIRAREAAAVAPSGIDQGVTRLALLAFIRGDNGPWHGGVGTERWVQYRGHHIDRYDRDDDGYVIAVTHRDYDDSTTTARLHVPRRRPSPNGVGVVTIMRDLDSIIDAVIAEHGLPGDEIVDVEIAETIDGATAARVIDSYAKFALDAVSSGQRLGKVRDYYIRAIERGEVQP